MANKKDIELVNIYINTLIYLSRFVKQHDSYVEFYGNLFQEG